MSYIHNRKLQISQIIYSASIRNHIVTVYHIHKYSAYINGHWALEGIYVACRYV